MTKRAYRSNVVRMPAPDAGYGARHQGKWRVNDAPPLTAIEIEFLREMLQDNSTVAVAAWIGVNIMTVMRLAAGLDGRLRPDTMAKFRSFFHKADLDSIRVVPGRDSPQKRGKTSGERKTR